MTQSSTSSSKDGCILDAQSVLDSMRQLARLTDWRGPASSEAVALARAIECTMNNLHSCFPPKTDELTWDIEACYVGTQSQTISIQLLRRGGKWEVDAAVLEAMLSLWLSSVNDEESKEPEPQGDSSSNSDQDGIALERKRFDDEWLRSKGTTVNRSLWILGKNTPSIARDLQWWIPRESLQILRVRAEEIVPLREARRVPKHRLVGFCEHADGDEAHPQRLQYLDLSNNGFEITNRISTATATQRMQKMRKMKNMSKATGIPPTNLSRVTAIPKIVLAPTTNMIFSVLTRPAKRTMRVMRVMRPEPQILRCWELSRISR